MRIQNIRLTMVMVVFVFMFTLLLYRVWELQIVDGEKYAETYEIKTTRFLRESNFRGNIYDCNGEILAYNKLVHTVTMIENGNYASGRERQLSLNSIIYRVMRKLAENEERINNELKIMIGEDGSYEYTVTGKTLERFQADVLGVTDPADLSKEQKDMSAGEMIQFLAGNSKFALYGEGKREYTEAELQEYGLPGSYTQEEILNMVGIRYMLSLNAYRKYVPIILAKDISEKTVAYMMENSGNLPGVEIGQEWERVYEGGEAFSHILGYVGKISAEELEAHADSEKNYTADSIVGKTGIEQYLESELQGVDGEKCVIVNNMGKIVGEETMVREAVSGKDVYLSVDKELQMTIYQVLEQKLAGIIESNLINAKEFDKTGIADTTDIRIPIYDVYIALFENSIIRTENFYDPESTELEKSIAGMWEKEQSEVIEALKMELLAGNTGYSELPAKMQACESYLVRESGILDETRIEKEDPVYIRWESGEDISLREFLLYAIDSGFVNAADIDAGQKYLTKEEVYQLLVENIEKRLRGSSEFKKMLFRYMILEDKISKNDICKLLYDQGILSVEDNDYEELLSGSMDAFSFMKKKIGQLEITPAQLALDPCSASAVVVQKETGQVLACVSYPGYDNNRLANQMDAKYYSQLLNDQSLPLYNRATQQLTAPGSTLKPVTIVAGLQEEVILPDTSIFCDGVFDKVTPVLRCWYHSGHGNVVNASTALQYSCNDYLCEISYRLGLSDKTADGIVGSTANGMGGNIGYDDNLAVSRLQEYAKLFHLDEKSGIEIDESSPHVTDAYGIQSAIGQGTHNYATVQLARYVNAVASEGNIAPLSLVKGITDINGVLREGEKDLDDQIELPDSVWDTVKRGMVQYAQNNAVLKSMEIPVAGKTGTAQESKRRPDHALFVGYAPAEDAEIAVAVRIANGYGSSNATAVGKSIFNYYFGIEKREDVVTGQATFAINIRTE